MLIIRGFVSGKPNALLNLIRQHDDNDYIENLKNPKAFIEYSNNIIQVDYKNIEDYKYWRCNALIVFDDCWYIIVDMIDNKKLNEMVTELFIRRTKLNIFAVAKDISLNSTHYLL